HRRGGAEHVGRHEPRRSRLCPQQRPHRGVSRRAGRARQARVVASPSGSLGERYEGHHLIFDGSLKSSGGGMSGMLISILTLLGSTFNGPSSRPVTKIGNAITSATMINCSPTQGIAPQ